MTRPPLPADGEQLWATPLRNAIFDVSDRIDTLAGSGGTGLTLNDVLDDLGTRALIASGIITATYNTTTNVLTLTTNTTNLNNLISARMGAKIIAGTGATVVYDSTAGSVTISASGGGGGGAVLSVNTLTGNVVLTADNIAETTARKWLTAAERTLVATITSKAPLNSPAFTGVPTVPNNTWPISSVDGLQQYVNSIPTTPSQIGARPMDLRHWIGTNGSGTWEPRPPLPAGYNATARSLHDPLAPPPPGAEAGDMWEPHPSVLA